MKTEMLVLSLVGLLALVGAAAAPGPIENPKFSPDRMAEIAAAMTTN